MPDLFFYLMCDASCPQINNYDLLLIFQVLPYRMMDQYVLLLQNVMQNDAVLTINPMTHPVYTPSQILSTFNAVAYQKCKYVNYRK